MKRSFPWLALAIGLLLALLLIRFTPLNPDAEWTLPLLTALLISEFGFVVTTVATVVGIREVMSQGLALRTALLVAGNLLLAIGFLTMGLSLWPGSGISGG